MQNMVLFLTTQTVLYHSAGCALHRGVSLRGWGWVLIAKLCNPVQGCDSPEEGAPFKRSFIEALWVISGPVTAGHGQKFGNNSKVQKLWAGVRPRQDEFGWGKEGVIIWGIWKANFRESLGKHEGVQCLRRKEDKEERRLLSGSKFLRSDDFP